MQAVYRPRKDTLFKTKIYKIDTLIKTKNDKIDNLFKTKIPKNIPWDGRTSPVSPYKGVYSPTPSPGNSRISKTQKQMFLLVRGGHICAPQRSSKRHQHGVFIQSLWIIVQTWCLAKLFEYSSSFISLILGFLHRLVSIFIFNGVTVKAQSPKRVFFLL